MKVRSILPTLWNNPANEPEPFRALQNEIDVLFDDFRTIPPYFQWKTGDRNGRLSMCCEVAETDKAIEVTAELPGVDEKDIEISLEGDMLKIRAEKKASKEEKTKDYHVVERSYGTFQRNLMLPFQPDAGKIEAKFDKGVLKIVVSKPTDVQLKAQKIEVKAAA